MISVFRSRFLETTSPQDEPNETTSTRAADETKTSDQRVDEFLGQYGDYKIQQQFRFLADQAKRDCEDILETAGIKGLVQIRSKKYASLQKKLKDMAKDTIFVERICKDMTAEDESDARQYHEGDIYVSFCNYRSRVLNCAEGMDHIVESIDLLCDPTNVVREA